MAGNRLFPWPVPLATTVLLAVCVGNVWGAEWDASNYPNPTAGGFRQCNMKTTASICDPDGVLPEAQRYRLNHELNQLEARTRQEHAGDFCSKKGVTGAMAVAKHIRGGSESAIKALSNDLLNRWDLDKQCQKAIVIVMATEDRKFWVARGDKVPVYAGEFTELFNAQKPLFKQGAYDQGLQNILQGTWEKAVSKQTGGTGPSGGRDRDRDRGRKPQPPPSSGGGGASDVKMPKIPVGLILAIVFIVVPLLLCCCCIYCCCCRGKGDSGNRRGPSDVEDGQGGGFVGGGGGGGAPGGRGGGAGGIGGFLRGAAGSAAGSAALNGIMGLIRNRNRGGGGGGVPMGPMGGGGDGGYTPASPTRHGDNPEGKGLYPSVPVKDEGGGGGW